MPAQRIRFRPSDADEVRSLGQADDGASAVLRDAIVKYLTLPERENKTERASVVLATFVPDEMMRAAVQKASREGRVLSDALMEIIRKP